MAKELIGTRDGQDFYVGTDAPDVPAVSSSTQTQNSTQNPTSNPSSGSFSSGISTGSSGSGTTAYPRVSPQMIGLTSDEQASYDASKKVVSTPYTPEQQNTDEQNLITQRRQQQQAQIDSVMKYFDSQLTSEKQAGQVRESETNAENLARGLIGSNVGNQAMEDTKTKNSQAVQAIQDKAASTIAGILSQIDSQAISDADARHKEAVAEARGNIDELEQIRQSRLQSQKTGQDNFAKLAGTSKLNWQDVVSEHPDLAQKLSDSTGYDPLELTMYWNSAKDAASQVQWDDKATHYDESRGVMVMAGFDPIQKKMVTQEFPIQGGSQQLVPKMFGKQLFLTPKNGIDTTKPLDGQMIPYGSVGQFSPSNTTTINLGSLGGGFGASDASSGRDESYLQTLPRAQADLVKNIADYKTDLTKVTSLRTNERQALAAQVMRYDPSFDMSQYASRAALRKDFNSGKNAQNLRSLNTAVGHLETLKEKGDALKNSSVPFWNKIKNAGLQQTGDPRVTEFLSAANAVESEMANVFKGTGATDQEIKSWRDNLSSAQSPEQIKGAIDTMIELMGSRLQSLQSQYESGMGKPSDFRFLNDKSRNILKGLGVDVNAIDPEPAQQSSGGQSIQITTSGDDTSYEDYLNSIQ